MRFSPGKQVSALVVAAGVMSSLADVACAVEFNVSFTPEVRGEPFSGRVYLFFSSQPGAPRQGPNWFHPEPFMAVEVVDWRPGEIVTIAPHLPDTLTFPKDFSSVDLRGKRVQAVARFNPWDRRVGTGTGNGYSDVVPVARGAEALSLAIRHIVPQRPFAETAWTKLLSVRSELLSDFHGRDVHLDAAVTLPAGYYRHPRRRYPTMFIVPGFSGTHHDGPRTPPVPERNQQGVEFLRVTLDPSCPLGHHVFADSANNGPVGTALVTEFVPAFDREFRSIPESAARFLTGHSSGGWSTLWLQMTHPEVFGGVWSTAPDPVDFRDFQRINLYRPGENMYVDAHGHRRPLARRDEQTVIWYDDFDWMEQVLGPGGQLHSFEAVFSPRGPDGTPRRLWDRETGEIDADVARAWRAYDLRVQLECRWPSLAERLQGKLHLFMGGEDTFLLEGSTRLLQAALARLGSDAVVEIHAGKDHSSLLTPALKRRIREEMVAQFLKEYPNWPDIAAGASVR